MALLGALALCAAGLPAEAAGQIPHLDRLRSAFPPGILNRIEQIVKEAEKAGVPPSLLVDKALEGAAKGVAPGRVVSTLSSYAGRLRKARGLVGSRVGPNGLTAAADALDRGVSGGAIRTLAKGGSGDLSIRLIVFGDLRSAKVSEKRAQDLVRAAAARGYKGDRLLSVSAAVRRRIRQGAKPDEAASAVLEQLSGERPLN